jgi:hypothetical protein
VTEGEWPSTTDAGAMPEFLKGKAGDRKRRPFACACCRTVWDGLADERTKWVAVQEQSVVRYPRPPVESRLQGRVQVRPR